MQGLDYIRAPDIGADRTVFVAPNFPTDTFKHRFSSIQQAIDWIHNSDWYVDLDENNLAVVLVYPGHYKEQLTSWAHIHIKSMSDEVNLGARKSVLLTPPDGMSTDPILVAGLDHRYHITGFTISADSTAHGPYAYALLEGRFDNCLFQYGSFMEDSTDHPSDMHFLTCTFYPDGDDTPSFNMTGSRGHANRYLYFFNTWVYGNVITESTFIGGDAQIEFRDCPCSMKVTTGGDWNFVAKNTRIRSSGSTAGRNTFDTTGFVNLDNCGISGGMHFISNPASLSLTVCDFNVPFSVPIVGADITADVDILNVAYINNIQQNGLSGRIKYQCPDKPVGCNILNRYITIQDALDSCSAKSSILIYQNYTDLPKMTLPVDCDITIDCQREYSLSFTGDIVDVGIDQALNFIRFVNLTGDKIDVNGDNAILSFESSQYISAYITLTSGVDSFCVLYNSSIVATSGHPTVTVNNTDTLLVFGYSRVKGITGYPAVLWTVDADEKFKAKFSTLVHGDVGTNSPLSNTATGKIDISMYNCGMNSAWDASKFNNLIGSSNLTTDPNINF